MCIGALADARWLTGRETSHQRREVLSSHCSSVTRSIMPNSPHPSFSGCEQACFGCRAYVLVAWIWSFIWHLPLDLIKWMMAYILNEDGFRDRMHGRTPATMAADAPPVVIKEGEGKPDAGAAPNIARTSAGSRPALGRNSVQVALIS